MIKADPVRYLRILLGWGAVALVLALAGSAVDGRLSSNFWVFRCSPAGYSAEFYMGTCADRAFGDYEHAALWLDKEPAAVANLKAADVVFLGNSRAVIAFSAEAVRRPFEDRGLKTFNASINGEWDLFAKMVVQKLDLRPRLVVVNADYFFFNSINLWGRRVVSGHPEVTLEYELKSRVLDLHRRWCRDEPNRFSDMICGRHMAQYRSRLNGRALTVDFARDSFPVMKPATGEPRGLDHIVATGREFRRMVEERGGCLILTAVPSIEANPEVVRRMAAAIGSPLVDVPAEGYASFDGNHLTVPEAERWGEAFAQRLPPALAACGR
ncbi:hypothetical protein [Magnetospirillum sp. SS-4]|uniref:hypothetical protein n=1 Tax=Magnetospirillum sp. SS-4 TaxID=2681465 RepID=UPI0013849C29|nr:hypothetical protein [Magnetospirillum sp. SS-4]CAA7614445.1 exported hypothetical protein [Magnetospirillum sp. SS-4]